MTIRRKYKMNDENKNIDELSYYLEYLSRIMPTTMPEWMN